MSTQVEEPQKVSDYLAKSEILDFDTTTIQELVAERTWDFLSDYEKIEQIYQFVRNQIKFGYNLDDTIPASQVLQEGYGQCNTKANLFMALLRSVGIPNRIHGFTVRKTLKKGLIKGIWYWLAPKAIMHSWVEVHFEGHWYNLEGIILDQGYLSALQNRFSDCAGTFCGYGVYSKNFQNPPIDWSKNHTYIQHEGIDRDLGIFATPDELYSRYQQKLNPIERWIYQKYVRLKMNRKVQKIRSRTAF
jgi:hypothetical protein